MALKNNKPNPLNFFNLRSVIFPAPHFKYTIIEKYNPAFTQHVNSWIETNLNNRYYIGQDITLDQNNSFIYTTRIGFETEKELSFFMIACPYLQSR